LHVRKIDAYVDDLPTFLAKGSGHAMTGLDDGLGGTRLKGHCDNGVLQVDKDEGGFRGSKTQGTNMQGHGQAP
jgi:hypothetical protein